MRKSLIEHRRWNILYILNAAPSNSANQDVILMILHDSGIPAQKDELEHDLYHLKKHNLIDLRKYVFNFDERMWVVQLTREGYQAFKGWLSIPGVKKHG